MILANYQRALVCQIYDILVNGEDQNAGITLYGSAGTGKSTIAHGLLEQLQEDWYTFYLEGISQDLSPYLTWYIGTKLHSKQKLALGSEISFGMSFPPTPFSLELGVSPQRKEKNFILTSSEQALISDIKKQTGSNHNILFIADRYELWDIPSKHFLQKIFLPQLNLLSEYHLTVLIISCEKVSMETSIQWNYISVPKITDDNILFVLRQQKHSGFFDVSKIRLCAGDDLSLALMAADYYDGTNIPPLTFHEILDRRYKELPEEERDACRVLEPLAIIDSCFTKDETAFFIDPAPRDEFETEYWAEASLALAEERNFIVGAESFHFTSNKIREYFKAQLSKREKLYHRKFADYLQKCHSEDYYSRGQHLKQSIQTNDLKVIRDAWQLLFLAYIRRSSETGDTEDVYQIFADIKGLLMRLSPSLSKTQNHVLDELLAGFKEFSMYHYKNTLIHLQSVTASQLSPVCLAEVQRLVLLCYVQLADNHQGILQRAQELYDTINGEKFVEDEQYCRAALVLLDVYIDRSNNAQKVNTLNKRLIDIIQKYPGRPVFEELEACYNRKAALYYTAVIAFRQTAQSVQFYRNRQNLSGLYMALCNHSGNALVSGNYIDANRSISECVNLHRDASRSYYPSQYKVENNQILLSYLQEENEAGNNDETLLLAARKACENFKKIRDRQEDEVSHVIFFNYLGLSIFCSSSSWQEDLAFANLHYAETDEYYQFFLHDLNFASSLLQGDLYTAQNELTLLKKLDVPLLRDYKQILFRRQCEQELLLKSPKQLGCDPLMYHKKIVTACSHVQDSSCRFYGRGFLLSDLQFLSF